MPNIGESDERKCSLRNQEKSEGGARRKAEMMFVARRC
jgi:hypothetical protein